MTKKEYYNKSRTFEYKSVFYSYIGIILCIIATCCTKEPIVPDNTVYDIDGNLYNTIQIGTQTWLQSNLKVITLNDGISIPETRADISWTNTNKPAYCWAKNNSKDILYNWYTVNTNKLCPIDYHIPSDTEFKILEEYIGMHPEVINLVGWRGVNEAIKLKATYSWSCNGNGTDDYGFSALSTGYRSYYGAFEHNDTQTIFWSSTSANSEDAWRRDILCDNETIYRGTIYKGNGLSVRCVKN